eukprot:COSAG06_NODE_5745_length_3295_cov_2.365770_2_plen_106_part_00
MAARQGSDDDKTVTALDARAASAHILPARVVMLSAAMNQGDTRQLGKDLELSLPSTVTSVSQVHEGPSSSPVGLAEFEQLWSLLHRHDNLIPRTGKATMMACRRT